MTIALTAIVASLATFCVLFVVAHYWYQKRKLQALAKPGSLNISMFTGEVIVNPPDGYTPNATFKSGVWTVSFREFEELDQIWK